MLGPCRLHRQHAPDTDIAIAENGDREGTRATEGLAQDVSRAAHDLSHPGPYDVFLRGSSRMNQLSQSVREPPPSVTVNARFSDAISHRCVARVP